MGHVTRKVVKTSTLMVSRNYVELSFSTLHGGISVTFYETAHYKLPSADFFWELRGTVYLLLTPPLHFKLERLQY